MIEIAEGKPSRASNWLLVALLRLHGGDAAGARNCFALAAAENPALVRALDLMVRAPAGETLGAAKAEDALWQAISHYDLQGSVAALKAPESEGDMAHRLLRVLNARGSLGEDVRALVDQAMRSVDSFRAIVAQKAFGIVVQPIVDIFTASIHHYEALCRLPGASVTDSPFADITFAEQVGLIHEFDLAMAGKVVEWVDTMGVSADFPRIAVNVSGHSIQHQDYIDGIMALLDRHPQAADRLMFEITESARMGDLLRANGLIRTLREAGVPVCLDDFGAGAASFQYLSALDVDIVKIDGTAIRNAQKSDKGTALLSSLTHMCRQIGTKTVAEMIENFEQLAFCRECGCDLAQGYLFGKPSRSPSDFAHLATAG